MQKAREGEGHDTISKIRHPINTFLLELGAIEKQTAILELIKGSTRVSNIILYFMKKKLKRLFEINYLCVFSKN